MKIGVQIRWTEGIKEYFELVSLRGFECVEIYTPIPPAEANKFFEKAEEFRGNSVKFGCDLMLHCGPIIYLLYPQKEVRELVWNSLKRHLEFAKKIGAKRISFHSPKYGRFSIWEDFFPVAEKDNKERFVDLKTARELYKKRLQELYQLSLKMGIRIAIENSLPIPESYTHFCVFPEEIEDLIGTSDIDILFDTGHANVTGLPLEYFAEQFGNRIKEVHLHDNDGTGDHHKFPGQGSINFQSAFQGLKSVGFDGDVILECFGFLENAQLCKIIRQDIMGWMNQDG